MLALAAFFAVHASLRYFRFGALQASSSATWRSAKPQSGCLSCGSLPTNQLRQSATRHRLVAGRPTAASAVLGALASQRTTARSRGIRHHCMALGICGLKVRCAQAVTTMVSRRSSHKSSFCKAAPSCQNICKQRSTTCHGTGSQSCNSQTSFKVLRPACSQRPLLRAPA